MVSSLWKASSIISSRQENYYVGLVELFHVVGSTHYRNSAIIGILNILPESLSKMSLVGLVDSFA